MPTENQGKGGYATCKQGRMCPQNSDHRPPGQVAFPSRPQQLPMTPPRPLRAIFGPQNLKCGPQKLTLTPKVPSPVPGAPLLLTGGTEENPESLPISPMKIQTIFQGICPICRHEAKRWKMPPGQGSRRAASVNLIA